MSHRDSRHVSGTTSTGAERLPDGTAEGQSRAGQDPRSHRRPLPHSTGASQLTDADPAGPHPVTLWAAEYQRVVNHRHTDAPEGSSSWSRRKCALFVSIWSFGQAASEGRK